MKYNIRVGLWCSLLCGSMAALMASPPVIGVARSWGAFLINDASVPGSATLIDGTSLKTVDAASNLNLTGGERVTLYSNAAATFHRGRMLLECGAAEFTGNADYRVEARNLRIAPSDSAALFRVGVDRRNQVTIASLSGAAEVRNALGMLVALVLPGTALTLSGAGSSAVELNGKVEEQNGKFYLTDKVSKIKVELRGSNLKSLVGKQIHVVGTDSGEAAVAGAPQAVSVTTATAVGTPVTGAGGAAAGAGVAGISFPTIAIIGGVVAVGGTVGGLAATGVIGNSPSVSR